MKINKQFQSNKMNQLFHELYLSSAEDTPARYSIIHDHFMQIYGAGDYRIFSAPGRVEVSGNHTDHNNGLVIATAVDCDTVCFARKREDMVINLSSFGYAPITVNLNNLDICKEEYNTTIALVRGVAAGLRKNNHKICGFDAVVHSTVLSGSGLSSSAAFEVLLAKTISTLCNEDIDPIECAKIAQFAENHYFGKPSGLMDQLASSVGGLIAIDFLDPTTPSVQKLSLDLQQYGYHLIITDTGGSHADLTPHYATIPEEMHMVAQYYNKETLRDVDAKIFMQDLHQLRDELPHRALLRALHYFNENARVKRQIDAIIEGDMRLFLDMVKSSGESSYHLLQNIYASKEYQGLALALHIASEVLRDNGAWRVHGGGFAGTMLAFVPTAKKEEYVSAMNNMFGMGAAAVMGIRNCGAIEITV